MEVLSFPELGLRFNPLKRFANPTRNSEASVHLQKAKASFLGAHASKRVRQSDIPEFAQESAGHYDRGFIYSITRGKVEGYHFVLVSIYSHESPVASCGHAVASGRMYEDMPSFAQFSLLSPIG